MMRMPHTCPKCHAPHALEYWMTICPQCWKKQQIIEAGCKRTEARWADKRRAELLREVDNPLIADVVVRIEARELDAKSAVAYMARRMKKRRTNNG